MSDRPRTYLDCTLDRVVDGDTCDVALDLGLRMTRTERLRLYGIDCPETHAANPTERDAAHQATEYASAWLSAGPFDVSTYTADDFGRWLAVLTRDGATLNDALVAQHLAVPYHGRPTDKRWRDTYLTGGTTA